MGELTRIRYDGFMLDLYGDRVVIRNNEEHEIGSWPGPDLSEAEAEHLLELRSTAFELGKMAGRESMAKDIRTLLGLEI